MQTNDYCSSARGIIFFKSSILEMGDFLMKENKNIHFLNDIYKIVEMGIIGINDVIDKTKKAKFRDLLEHQRDEYREILKECETLFISYGAQEKELGFMTKMNSFMMSEMKIRKGDEDDAIAKMMIEGTQKGISRIETILNTYPTDDEEAKTLAEKLTDTLKHNIEDLKIYL